MAAATDPRRAGGRGSDTGPRKRPARPTDPDRVSVLLFSLAAVLVVLAVLASQVTASSSSRPVHRQVVIRRIYRTTVIDTTPGQGGGTSVSQSVSGSGAGPSPAAAPVTSSSH